MVSIATLADLDGEPHATAFPGEEPRAVRLSLSAGESVPAHSHPDRDVLVHVVDGELVLDLDGDSHAVGAGDLVRFGGETEVAPEAVADATALVVLAPRQS